MFQSFFWARREILKQVLYFARLSVSLWETKKIVGTRFEKTKVNFVFLVRLSVSLHYELEETYISTAPGYGGATQSRQRRALGVSARL